MDKITSVLQQIFGITFTTATISITTFQYFDQQPFLPPQLPLLLPSYLPGFLTFPACIFHIYSNMQMCVFIL